MIWPLRTSSALSSAPCFNILQGQGQSSSIFSSIGIETYFDFLSCLLIRIGDQARRSGSVAFDVWKWPTFLPTLKIFVRVDIWGTFAVAPHREGVGRRWRSGGNGAAPSWASPWRLGSTVCLLDPDGKGQHWDWERATIFTSACSPVPLWLWAWWLWEYGRVESWHRLWYFHYRHDQHWHKWDLFEQQLFGNTNAWASCRGFPEVAGGKRQ